MMKETIAVTIITLLLACDGSQSPDTEATLLFRSGFETGVYLEAPKDVSIGYYQLLQGTDAQTGYSWPIQILGTTEGGLHLIDDDDGQALRNEIQTVVGHDGEMTRALYSEQNYARGVTQSPYEIVKIQEGRKDLYVKYWMKVDAQSNEQIDKWRALFEYKTKGYADGDGFRLIAYIYTDEQGNAFWHWQGDIDPDKPAIWEIDNKEIPVPKDEWFLTEFYWHWSEGDDGRALWKINGEVVGDHYGPTTINSQPIDLIMLTQIYGDANPKHQWIDDIEIWDALPPESAQ